MEWTKGSEGHWFEAIEIVVEYQSGRRQIEPDHKQYSDSGAESNLSNVATAGLIFPCEIMQVSSNDSTSAQAHGIYYPKL